ncbi:MAG TPA: Xaa-Pro peptidase family protein [Gemmatimonadales bacterium]
MERREFVAALGGAVLLGPAVGRSGGQSIRGVRPPQEPALGPEVFARRLDRLRAELDRRKLDLFVAAPSTNFAYYTGASPGRSERLILLLVPAKGDAAIVAPSFEVERVKRASAVTDVRGWDEQDDPWKLVRTALQAMKPAHRAGQGAIEASLDYGAALRLFDVAGGNWKWQSGAPITERLRLIKYPEEIALIRRAIEITEASIAATFAALVPGVTEREVAAKLSEEMRARGAGGGGLVQFGPSSALPHGGPGGSALQKEMVVLIDAGSQVSGYTSDITRTTWFGDAPADEFKKVFNLVHDAQTAAMALGRPFTVRCQEMDEAARRVITAGGYGQYFTHRLGHGMGMDGHEPPYLVEGNDTPLEPGMVFTIEPGIYQPDKFGVRIEDDTLVTDAGVEVLSQRPAKL